MDVREGDKNSSGAQMPDHPVTLRVPPLLAKGGENTLWAAGPLFRYLSVPLCKPVNDTCAARTDCRSQFISVEGES